jgi:hypothetical protein
MTDDRSNHHKRQPSNQKGKKKKNRGNGLSNRANHDQVLKKKNIYTDGQRDRDRYFQLFPGIGAPAPPVDALPVAAAVAAAALASSAIRIISIRIVCCSTVSAVVAA